MHRLFRLAPALVLLAFVLCGAPAVWATGPAPAAQAWLGIEMEPTEAAVTVRHVFHGSPAEHLGLRAGDVLLKADERPLAKPDELVAHVGGLRPGERMWLVVQRGGRAETRQVVLGVHPGLDYLNRGIHLGKEARPFGKLRPVFGAVPRKLRHLRGQVVLIDFFAGWCTACGALAPKLNEWQARYGARGLTVLGITNDTPAMATATVKDWKLAFPVAIDLGKRTTEAYRVRAVPTLHIVDRKGITRDVRVGKDAADTIEIERVLQELLAEP